MSRPALEAVLFDLDGTLLDSVELILASYRHTLAAHERPPVPDAEILATMGRPLDRTLAGWARDEAEGAAMGDTYRAWNRAHHDQLAQAYPGVTEAVTGLAAAGLRLAVVTSKNRRSAGMGLERMGLVRTFELVVTIEDTTRHKPDPEPVAFACDRLDLAPERVVYVGDAVHDLRSGRAAGARTAAVGWGPQVRDLLEAERPDYWIETPRDLALLR